VTKLETIEERPSTTRLDLDLAIQDLWRKFFEIRRVHPDFSLSDSDMSVWAQLTLHPAVGDVSVTMEVSDTKNDSRERSSP